MNVYIAQYVDFCLNIFGRRDIDPDGVDLLRLGDCGKNVSQTRCRRIPVLWTSQKTTTRQHRSTLDQHMNINVSFLSFTQKKNLTMY